MGVPDTTTFTLQNVVTEVNPTTDDLVDCFADADSNKFDSTYEGSKNQLLNFRNYGNQGWITTDISLSQTQALANTFYNNNASDTQVYVDDTGNRLFIVDSANKRVRQYSFATSNDITSALTFVNNSPSLSYNFSGFTFKSDGTKMYVLAFDDKIYEHDITKDAFDIATLDTTASSSITLPSTTNQSFSFNRTGTTLYVIYKPSSSVVTNATYALSTAWDLSTAASPTTSVITSSTSTDLRGGVYMYESTGTYDHWITFGGSNPYAVDFRDGITTSDINSTSSSQQLGSGSVKPSCINNALIYDVERSGTTAPFTWTLRKYLTNV
tara:strand:+ start:21 stop:995 length:975 start_codon:yes stop_codon:yes gene_type:complete